MIKQDDNGYNDNMELPTNPRYAREYSSHEISGIDMVLDLEDIPTNSLSSFHLEIENIRLSSGFTMADSSTLATLGLDKSSILSTSTHRSSSSFEGFIEKCIYNDTINSVYTYRIIRLSTSNRAVFDIKERDSLNEENSLN